MSRPSWGISQAAEECGVSPNTIRRRIKNGSLPSAEQHKGKWSIPITDLIAAGLNPGQPKGPDELPTQVTHLPNMGNQMSNPVSKQDTNALVKRVSELEHELTKERAHTEDLGNQVSNLKDNLADVRLAMRMLETAPVRESNTEHEPPTTNPDCTSAQVPASKRSNRFIARLFRRQNDEPAQ